MFDSGTIPHRVAVAVAAIAFCAASQSRAQLPCVGDCNGNEVVAINELITGVNIALGNRAVADCTAFDSNGNGVVAVNELIQAVNAALGGCVAGEPTATPTGSGVTETPSSATPTAGDLTATATVPGQPSETPTATAIVATSTPGVVAGQVAGASAAIANALSSIANAVGAVVTGATGSVGGVGAAVSGLEGGGAGNSLDLCELGGTVRSQFTLAGPSAIDLSIDFDMCEVPRSGGSVLFNGSLAISNLSTATFVGTGTFNATISYLGEQGQLLTQTIAALGSPVRVVIAPGEGEPCTIAIPSVGGRIITGIDLRELNGTLAADTPGEGLAEATFQSTFVDLDIRESGAECLPSAFDVSFNGAGEISQSTDAGTVAFDVGFSAFALSAVQSGDASLVSLTGRLSSDCFGGTVTLGTPQSLSVTLGEFCPNAGVVSVQGGGEVVYSADGLQVGTKSFTSCLDPTLLTCTQ